MKQNEWLMLALAVGGVAIIASRLSDIERGAGEFGRGLGRIFGDIRAPRPQPTAADDPSPPESLLVSRSTHRGIQILVFVDPIDLTFEYRAGPIETEEFPELVISGGGFAAARFALADAIMAVDGALGVS